MKFNELSTTGTKDKPSKLMLSRLEAESSGIPFADYLAGFDFESPREIEKAVRKLALRETEDLYMRNKDNQADIPSVGILFLRAKGLRVKPDILDKFAENTATAVWTRFFAPKIRAAKIAAAFSVRPDRAIFNAAAATIRDVYDLTAAEIEKLQFFACQVKEGEEFPKSLRRMLYLWGTTKKTGKTTTAEIIAAILNGDDRRGESIYTTTLSREMQIDNYAVPLITTCRCCIMDEAMYKDMTKTYNRFKAMMTTTDGTARLPYGQTFCWHGLPNYIATSNDGLQTFIKDYGDRRFLSVHFNHAPRQMDEESLTQLWRDFITHAEKPKDWHEWSADIAQTADEKGARGVTVDDLVVYFQSQEWYNIMRALPDVSQWHSSNRLTRLRLAAMTANNFGQPDLARNCPEEIEAAFSEVFGGKVPGQSWWSIRDCKAVMNGHVAETQQTQQTENQYNSNSNEKEDDPF